MWLNRNHPHNTKEVDNAVRCEHCERPANEHWMSRNAASELLSDVGNPSVVSWDCCEEDEDLVPPIQQ